MPSNIKCSKKCAKPVLPGTSFFRAHVIPNLNVDHWRVMRLHNQNGEAIIEFHLVNFGDRKLDRGSRGRCESQPEDAGRERKKCDSAPAE